MNIFLWVIQALVALIFLAVGGMKTFVPSTTLKNMLPLANTMPLLYTRLIGILEVLGAFGLLLPGITGIQMWLTIAAATGLFIMMVGAIVVHLARGEQKQIGTPVVLLLLTLLIAIGRFVLSPF